MQGKNVLEDLWQQVIRASEDRWQQVSRAIEENWPRSKILTSEEIVEADNWCKENCQGPYIKAVSRVYVKEERDAVMFLLRWA